MKSILLKIINERYFDYSLYLLILTILGLNLVLIIE